jgi:hypothetical protein
VFFFQCVSFLISPCGPSYTATSQTVKDASADQGTLVEMFERIEAFFRRLEIYIGVAPNQEMMDIIMIIMVDILNISAIATKELKQGRISKSLLFN